MEGPICEHCQTVGGHSLERVSESRHKGANDKAKREARFPVLRCCGRKPFRSLWTDDFLRVFFIACVSLLILCGSSGIYRDRPRPAVMDGTTHRRQTG